MYLLCELIESLFLCIGNEFGGKDYMIVIYVYDKIIKVFKIDVEL